MSIDTAKNKLEKYLDIFEQLTNLMSWVTDKRIRMSIASQFIADEKTFDANKLREAFDYIKKETKWYSGLSEEMKYMLAALLINEYSDPKEAFDQLKDCYDALVNAKFRKGPYTYLAAYILLTQKNEGQSLEEQSARAMEIYKAIKSRHIFITSHDDYPLSVLLAKDTRSVTEQMENIEYFYDYLGAASFRKGNDLQFLSHILAYSEDDKRELTTDNCLAFFEEFRRRSLKVKGIHYPVLGVLALLEKPEQAVHAIVEIYEMLNVEKHFRWYKEMSFLLATHIYIIDKIDRHDIISISMATNIQAIIQAQQAASLAAITAAGAAVASSSSN